MINPSSVHDDSIRAPLDVADIFNGYVGAHVIHSLDQLGVWERLLGGPASVVTLSARQGANVTKMRALLDCAIVLGHVRIDGGMVSLTPAGDDVVANRGFFTWAVGGYQEILHEMPALATGRKRWGQDVRRDEAMVAAGSARVGFARMVGVEAAVLGGLDYTSVVDIGCGDGSRLLRLCQGYPPRRGVGIDISEPACNLATKQVADAGLADHIKIICQNIFEPDSKAVFPGIALVSSFLMMHDLFAIYDGDGAQVMEALRKAFPDARYFLLADTNTHPWAEESGGRLPMFSLQFELVHAFMDTPIHPRDLYERVFAAAGMHLERCEPLGVPSTWLYLLRVPEGA